jgi:hypothetical protein
LKFVRRDPAKGYLDNVLWIPKAHANTQAVKAALTFAFSDGKTAKVALLYRETEHHLLAPREFWDPAKDCDFPVVDVRPRSYPRTGITSRIQLDARNPSLTMQRDAFAALQKARGGVLQLRCGGGKTVIALALLEALGCPGLVVVDNTTLLEQWRTEAESHLTVPGGLGLIQGRKWDWRKGLVFTTYQTLAAYADEFPPEMRRWFGVVFFDEAHHLGAPTFAKAADVTYGRRYALTATPERADGMQVVHQNHCGQVLYKNLVQELRPEIRFRWTGLSLDLTDPDVRKRVCDINGELHLSMLYGFFGTWQPRLDIIHEEVTNALAEDRRVLVLSYSITELVNLVAMHNKHALYTDLVPPDEPMALLDERTLGKLRKLYGVLTGMLKDPTHRRQKTLERQHVAERLAMHERALKYERGNERRQLEFMRDMIAMPQAPGLLIGAIKPKERQRMLAERQTTYSIMKYGREGLDSPALDTGVICEPQKQKGGIAQLLGRFLRPKPGKKDPRVTFLEDEIGPIMGLCKAIRRELRMWPPDEGGPLEFSQVGYPQKARPKWSKGLRRTSMNGSL